MNPSSTSTSTSTSTTLLEHPTPEHPPPADSTLDDPGMQKDPNGLERVPLAETSPEWVQAEFERIIAEEWPPPHRRRWSPPVTAPPRPTPHRPGPVHPPHQGTTPPANTGSPARHGPPRQRSPPPDAFPEVVHPPTAFTPDHVRPPS